MKNQKTLWYVGGLAVVAVAAIVIFGSTNLFKGAFQTTPTTTQTQRAQFQCPTSVTLFNNINGNSTSTDYINMYNSIKSEIASGSTCPYRIVLLGEGGREDQIICKVSELSFYDPKYSIKCQKSINGILVNYNTLAEAGSNYAVEGIVRYSYNVENVSSSSLKNKIKYEKVNNNYF